MEDQFETRATTPTMKSTTAEEVIEFLELKIDVATKMGLSLTSRT